MKSVAWIEDLMAKFSDPRDLVMDPFSGTISKAKTCLSLRNHRWFISCDTDSECFDAALPILLQVFVKQVQHEQSYITFDYNV